MSKIFCLTDKVGESALFVFLQLSGIENFVSIRGYHNILSKFCFSHSTYIFHKKEFPGVSEHMPVLHVNNLQALIFWDLENVMKKFGTTFCDFEKILKTK